MATADDQIKQQHKINLPTGEDVKTPEEEGETGVGGSMTDPEADDNAEKPLEEYIGNRPTGKNLGDVIEEDSKNEE